MFLNGSAAFRTSPAATAYHTTASASRRSWTASSVARARRRTTIPEELRRCTNGAAYLAFARVKVAAPVPHAFVTVHETNSRQTRRFATFPFAVSRQLANDPLATLDVFPRRHIGPRAKDVEEMLKTLHLEDLEQLVAKVVPDQVRAKRGMGVMGDMSPEGITESEMLKSLRQIGSRNKVYRSYIGCGYTDVVLPNVIKRNVLENPGWYTQYTPYQPEIAQGRLECLLNYQTMVKDLTGLPIANASLLDEATAAAEAMAMCYSTANRKRTKFFVDVAVHPQTVACLQTRAEGLKINVVLGNWRSFDFDSIKSDLAGVLVQYPDTYGSVEDYSDFAQHIHSYGGLVVAATDLMALTLLKPPGEFGADIAIGSSQRFGVPMGYGGPHAAFFSCREDQRRRLPGRIVGVSRDADGSLALRLSLQTREQHIRREKATSNICTAQALLANIAALYVVFHGPDGLKAIASRIHIITTILAEGVRTAGHKVMNKHYFDTLTVSTKSADQLMRKALEHGINLRKLDNTSVGVQLDETVTERDLDDLLAVFGCSKSAADVVSTAKNGGSFETAAIPEQLRRTSAYLTHPTFNMYHSETEMLRYIHRLQNKDLSLTHSMIPLGSCTMKLNATTEMIPVTWPEFSQLHPFVPEDQAKGYKRLLQELEHDIAAMTHFQGVSLQPNSGAQGEYTGLRVIRAYHDARGDVHRTVCLIPVSAHGTNPASAAMAGFEVVTIKCLGDGTLDMHDLATKVKKHADKLGCVMITYPSTFGVFEKEVKDACKMVHAVGGQVYMDGANLNAQIGVCSPGEIGADVCHLNLHKTFCIPHGGGGPGVGPIACAAHLMPYLPGHPMVKVGGNKAIGPVSAAPYGSAGILCISYAYIKMMGAQGLTRATQIAILNANYMAARLAGHYKILYKSANGMCGHEFIVDVRPFENSADITNVDIAKRLQDYSFHSPTMSWPTPGTLMIEPTESESKEELDRFCNAMIQIREEISEVERGEQPRGNNVLSNAPHPIPSLLSEEWNRPYPREKAAYPLPYLRERKFWPTTRRIDDAFGDRNLVCSCPSPEEFEKM